MLGINPDTKQPLYARSNWALSSLNNYKVAHERQMTDCYTCHH